MYVVRVCFVFPLEDLFFHLIIILFSMFNVMEMFKVCVEKQVFRWVLNPQPPDHWTGVITTIPPSMSVSLHIRF